MWTNGESEDETYISGNFTKTRKQTGLCDSLEGVGWDGRWREGQAEGDICIHG